MKIADLPAVARILRGDYRRHEAPVVEFIKAQTQDVFKILVSTILSARTQDATTASAAERLFRSVTTPDDLRRIPVAELESLIYPVGFYHTKASHLKALPDELDRLFAGRIPDTVEELCRLPGVGRKTANLVVAVGHGKPAICVDVHVHRISNRFGLVCTRTPFETEMRLRELLPIRYWMDWNSILVSHGQRVCRPICPRCSRCRVRLYCSRVGVVRSA